MSEIETIESIRCGISFLFEIDLNKDSSLASKHYLNRFQSLGENNPDVWAYDSFRSIDPFYVHNYVIAELIGADIISNLREQFWLSTIIMG